MKRFRIEHKSWDVPITYITLYNPPYTKADVISRTKWKLKDVTITEVKHGEE